MTRSLFLKALRYQGVLLGCAWFGLVLFEFALIWVAARIDTGLGLRGLVEMLVPPDIREVIFSQGPYCVSNFAMNCALKSSCIEKYGVKKCKTV